MMAFLLKFFIYKTNIFVAEVQKYTIKRKVYIISPKFCNKAKFTDLGITLNATYTISDKAGQGYVKKLRII